MILGPVSHNVYPPTDQGGINPSGALRKRLELYANVRPAKTPPGMAPRCGKPVDLVVMRENTEGFYSDRNMSWAQASSCRRRTSRLRSARSPAKARRASPKPASSSLCRAAQKVCVVHKANVLRVSDGLFLECTRAVAARYPQVQVEEQIMDAMAALLVRDASRFDVIVTTNAFGDILSDEASEISGSLGLAASLNHGDEHGVAQAQHGSAPDIEGQDKANPASLIGSAAMLLAWLGERRKSDKLTQGRQVDRARARQDDREPAMAHRRSRRPARHQGVRRAAVEDGGGACKVAHCSPDPVLSLPHERAVPASGAYETAQFHHRARRRGGGMAAARARATSDAGDRLSQPDVA